MSDTPDKSEMYYVIGFALACRADDERYNARRQRDDRTEQRKRCASFGLAVVEMIERAIEPVDPTSRELVADQFLRHLSREASMLVFEPENPKRAANLLRVLEDDPATAEVLRMPVRELVLSELARRQPRKYSGDVGDEWNRCQRCKTLVTEPDYLCRVCIPPKRLSDAAIGQRTNEVS